ncbi:MAG: hypothetical protein BACD_02855 [Bacteroides rodentium]
MFSIKAYSNQHSASIFNLSKIPCESTPYFAFTSIPHSVHMVMAAAMDCSSFAIIS